MALHRCMMLILKTAESVISSRERWSFTTNVRKKPAGLDTAVAAAPANPQLALLTSDDLVLIETYLQRRFQLDRSVRTALLFRSLFALQTKPACTAIGAIDG